MVLQAISIWGKIDILVNTAGTHTENVDFWTVSETEYDRVLDINLKGCYFVSQKVASYMKENDIKGHLALLLVGNHHGRLIEYLREH